MMHLQVFDVAPISFVLPAIIFIGLPVLAIICILIAVLIIKKRQKKANQPAPKAEPVLAVSPKEKAPEKGEEVKKDD
jgi:hypothetical protein